VEGCALGEVAWLQPVRFWRLHSGSDIGPGLVQSRLRWRGSTFRPASPQSLAAGMVSGAQHGFPDEKVEQSFVERLA